MDKSSKTDSIRALEREVERLRNAISRQKNKYGAKYQAELLLRLQRLVIYMKTGL